MVLRHSSRGRPGSAGTTEPDALAMMVTMKQNDAPFSFDQLEAQQPDVDETVLAVRLGIGMGRGPAPQARPIRSTTTAVTTP